MINWKILKAEDYWLEMVGNKNGCVIYENGSKIGRPMWTIHVVAKWDGCVDYRQYSNGYEYDHKCGDDCQCCEDYIHICDVDNFIDVLKSIKEQAVKNYGEWPR
jgi:hypothetical protein